MGAGTSRPRGLAGTSRPKGLAGTSRPRGLGLRGRGSVETRRLHPRTEDGGDWGWDVSSQKKLWVARGATAPRRRRSREGLLVKDVRFKGPQVEIHRSGCGQGPAASGEEVVSELARARTWCRMSG